MRSPTLGEVARLEQTLAPLIEKIMTDISLVGDESRGLREWFLKLYDAIKEAGTRSAERI